MKAHLFSILCLDLLHVSFSQTFGQKNPIEYPQLSSRSQITQTIGISKVTIDYGRPNVISPQNGEDRTGQIWGDRVKYGYQPVSSYGFGNDRPWRAGANIATSISFSHDAKLEGQAVKAGKYGLFMLIEEESATIILSNDNNGWGSYFYREENDVLRIKVKTEDIPLTKILTYSFIETDKNKSVIVLDWEYKRIPFNVSFDTPSIVVDNLRKNILTLHYEPGWYGLNRAAQYCLDNNINIEEALEWSNQSINRGKSFANLATKSSLLDELGRKEEALIVIKEAMGLSDVKITDTYFYGDQLMKAGKTAKARIIFEHQLSKWPDHWRSSLGMAKVYASEGNDKKAQKMINESLSKTESEGIKRFIQNTFKN